MIKKIQKYVLSLLVAFMVLFVWGTTTEAAAAVKSLTAGKYTTHPGTGDVYYKISIPQDGFIKISAKHSKKDYEYITLYTSNKKETVTSDLNNGYSWFELDGKSSGSMTFPVKKGTYYIYADDYDGSWDTRSPLKIKYTFTKATNKANFCRSKASKLSKNKKVTIVNTYNNCYDRWYKVSLSKKQPINYYIVGAEDVLIYDSKGNELDVVCVNRETGRYYTYDKLKKGTYYVRIKYDYWDIKYDGASMCTFKWK